MIKYYLYLHNNLFEKENMICISLNDQEFWILRENDEPDFYYTKESLRFGMDISKSNDFGINKYQITPSAFFGIRNLSKKQKNLINKYKNPIDLFRMWGVLDEIGEHFI